MSRKMKVADLFSGVGGLSQGFIKAGCDIELAIEFDASIANAYQRNHPSTAVYNSNICDMDFIALRERHPHIDIVVGGPPCQGFSQKGKRLKLEDSRNFLFLRFVEFVKVFAPKYFVIENVPGIITTADGYFSDAIKAAFSELGYSVSYGVLGALDFGIPQNRHRAIFIGKKGKIAVDLPKPTNQKCNIEDAIYDLPFIASGEGVEHTNYTKPPVSEYQKMLRGNCEVLHNHVATKHSNAAIAKLELIPKGKGKEVLPKELLTKSIHSGTWCRLCEDGYAPTITTRFDTPSSGRFTHPVLHRCITVREAARIQSFPDDFIFYGTKTSQMKQVGNAVPPILAYNIAKSILISEANELS